MGVNSLPKTVTRQRRGCDLNPGPSAPDPSTLTTRLPVEPVSQSLSRPITESRYRVLPILLRRSEPIRRRVAGLVGRYRNSPTFDCFRPDVPQTGTLCDPGTDLQPVNTVRRSDGWYSYSLFVYQYKSGQNATL